MLLFLLACPKPAEPPAMGNASIWSEPSPSCPRRGDDPPTCPAGSALGSSPELPLEWGVMAAGNRLWGDRLACADGSIAAYQRLGNVGAAPVESSSPPSGAPRFGPDVVDRWSVDCGDGPTTLYTNLYRCGEICLPGGLRIVPGATAKEMEAMSAAAEARDMVAMHAAGERLVGVGRDFEVTWLVAASVAESAGDWSNAVAYWQGAIGILDTASSRASLAEALARSGRDVEARLELNTLLARYGDSPLRPQLVCTQSLLETDRQRQMALAEEACTGGWPRCCGSP